jgi:hypothetical protein
MAVLAIVFDDSFTNLHLFDALVNAGVFPPMLEIVVLPYMAVSFAIGWAIFSPMFRLENLDTFSFAKLETIDLIACFVPLCTLLSLTTNAVPYRAGTAYLLVLAFSLCVAFSTGSLVVSLFLLEKMEHRPSLKRMAIGAIVVPLGTLLTIAWVGIPIWAFSYSTLYSMPATLGVAIATFTIRQLCSWACGDDPQIG